MAKSEIIKQFVSGSIDTDVALKQLKVILSEISEPSILDWINHELVGYGINDKIPAYRKASGELVGTFLCFNVQAKNVAIPLKLDTPEEIKKV